MICSSKSVPTNQIYTVPEHVQHAQERQTESSMTICSNKGPSSPPKLSSIKSNHIVIKQEQEAMYDAKMATTFNDNENIQV